ncbi:MAG: hypothetical protein K2Y40_24645 [Reyranella sp.]|jgi:hypothetical protein|nr:hypothetical protein [Reyranella sp.]
MTANPGTDKVEAVAVELRLDRISRLYNSLDPAPFHEKELEAAADDYIVGSAEDTGGRPIRLVIMLPQTELARPEAAQIPASIRNHFALRERNEHRRLRAEWHRGRLSLLIGLGFLVLCLFARELLLSSEGTVPRMLAEGLLIVGWVAMWGPIDVFLYGWWPIAGRRRLFAALARLDVDLRPLR